MADEDGSKGLTRRDVLTGAAAIAAAGGVGAAAYSAWRNSTYLFLLKEAPTHAGRVDPAWQGSRVRSLPPARQDGRRDVGHLVRRRRHRQRRRRRARGRTRHQLLRHLARLQPYRQRASDRQGAQGAPRQGLHRLEVLHCRRTSAEGHAGSPTSSPRSRRASSACRPTISTSASFTSATISIG